MAMMMDGIWVKIDTLGCVRRLHGVESRGGGERGRERWGDDELGRWIHSVLVSESDAKG